VMSSVVAALVVVAGIAIADREAPTEIASTPGERAVPTTPEDGDPAWWKIDPATPPSPDRDSFRALVTRIGCNGGRTGPVLRPGVVVHEDRIEVTFTVEHVDGGRCPSNLPEAYDVDLGVPIGGRRLVDGRCNESTPVGDGGVIGLACFDGGVKWASPAANLDEAIQRLGCERVEEVNSPDMEITPLRAVVCGIGDRTFGVAQYRDAAEVGAAFESLEGVGMRVLGPSWIVSVNTPEAAGIALSKVGGSIFEIGS
jgi:hypothetical protein